MGKMGKEQYTQSQVVPPAEFKFLSHVELILIGDTKRFKIPFPYCLWYVWNEQIIRGQPRAQPFIHKDLDKL